MDDDGDRAKCRCPASRRVALIMEASGAPSMLAPHDKCCAAHGPATSAKGNEQEWDRPVDRSCRSRFADGIAATPRTGSLPGPAVVQRAPGPCRCLQSDALIHGFLSNAQSQYQEAPCCRSVVSWSAKPGAKPTQQNNKRDPAEPEMDRAMISVLTWCLLFRIRCVYS